MWGAEWGASHKKKITFYQFFPWPLIGLNSNQPFFNDQNYMVKAKFKQEIQIQKRFDQKFVLFQPITKYPTAR